MLPAEHASLSWTHEGQPPSQIRYCIFSNAFLAHPLLGFPVFLVLFYACMSPSIPRQVRWKLFAHTPLSAAAFPVERAGRLLRYMFRGLLNVHSHCNLHAHRVAKTTLCTEGSSGFVTSTAASVVTG